MYLASLMHCLYYDRCIMFEYMACEGSTDEGACECCGINQGKGNLLFVDPSTKRFIVVESDIGARYAHLPS